MFKPAPNRAITFEHPGGPGDNAAAMMRRWLRPGELAPLGGWDLWRLREVGAWGDAARVLGARWEAVGGAALVERFGDRLVPLWRDKQLGRWLGTLGVPNPDAILVDAGPRGAALRPVDLKWCIDTAEHGQVAGETLRRLVERAGDRLAAILPGNGIESAYGDGLFATPERRLNRLYIRSRANREDARPIADTDLLAIPVEPHAFYGPLPGWSAARRLAAADRVSDPAADLDLADRYFHLGIGVRGALMAERRTVFDDRPDTSDEALLRVEPAVEADLDAQLDALLGEVGDSVRLLVRQLGRARAERGAQRQRLRLLERSPYGYGAFMRDAARAGRRPASEDRASLAELRVIYRQVTVSHAAAVRARGRELVAAGATVAEAFELLEAERDAFLRRARDAARAALETTRQGRGTKLRT